jgi:hypothetical protein
MRLKASYTGPALVYVQGAYVDGPTQILGSFIVLEKTPTHVLLAAGEPECQYRYWVPRREWNLRSVEYERIADFECQHHGGPHGPLALAIALQQKETPCARDHHDRPH